MWTSPAAACGNPLSCDKRGELPEPRAVAGANGELDRDPAAVRKRRRDPARRGERRGGGRIGRRHPQREQPVRMRRDVGARQRVAALGRAAPATGDELREVAVARTVRREQHELHAIGQRELAADDELQSAGFGRQMGADDAAERAFVGDGEGGIALRMGAFDQLLRVRCATQEGEVRQAVQLGVGGEHGSGPRVPAAQGR